MSSFPDTDIMEFIRPISSPVRVMPQPAPSQSHWALKTIAIIVAVIIVTILLMMLLLSWYVIDEIDIHEKLMKSGWLLYTTPGCMYCEKQLEVLGDSYSGEIKCPGGDARCGSIQAFPTWYNKTTGAINPGYKTFNQLKSMLSNPTMQAL